MATTIEHVRRAFRDAKEAREVFLAEHGWKMDNDFPDQRPRYTKTFTTRTNSKREIALTAGGAFALERKIREN
jgi:hypothetical protein